MRARLIPLDGSAPIEIVKDLTVVGRTEDCDLRLQHRSVSKLHCVLARTDGLLFLRDLGSTNGTRVNGQRVRRAALLPNDEIWIANQKFRVWLGGDQRADEEGEATQKPGAESRDGSPRERDASAENGKQADPPAVRANALPDLYPER